MSNMNRKATHSQKRFTDDSGSRQRNFYKPGEQNRFGADPHTMTVHEKFCVHKKRRYALLIFSVLLIGALIFWSISQTAAEETVTYVALGDSLTAGVGASEEDYLRLAAFVPQLTAHLREEHEVYVENHGIPGLRTEQLRTYVQNDAAVRETIAEAHMVTVTIGGNDLLQLLSLPEVDEAPAAETIEQFVVLFTKTMEEIRTLNEDVPVFVMDLYNPYEEPHPRHDLGETLIPAYNDALLSEMEQLDNVHPVHVYDLFAGQGSAWTHIDQEDIHPNDAGYEKIYEAFREAFEAHL